MKVKIKDNEFKMKIIPREFTAVLISKDEPIKEDDYAFMIFHCPCPTTKKELNVIKQKAIEKAILEYEELERYLECNKTLHKGDKHEG